MIVKISKHHSKLTPRRTKSSRVPVPSVSLEEWPPGELRLIPKSEILSNVRVRDGSYLGLYEGPGGPGFTQVNIDMRRPKLICVGTSPVALSRKIGKLRVSWPLFARCEKAKALFPTHLEADKASEAEKTLRELKRNTSEAIAKVRWRLDPKYFGLRTISLKGYPWILGERLADGLIRREKAG
jgi:hypothetical protein